MTSIPTSSMSSCIFRIWCAFLCFSVLSSSVIAQNCVLQVPADPLTAAGLATPYIMSGGCVQTPLAMGGTASFVQATIVDLDTGRLFAYTPLVVTAANPMAIKPVQPKLPANYTAGLWFGTNGNSLTLASTLTTSAATTNTIDSLVQGNCVNGGGTPWTIFGQFASCNGRQFFDAVYALVNKGLIQVVNPATVPGGKLLANQVPALGTDLNGDPCPTTHSFSIVDQDQSDNTDAAYLYLPATGGLAVATVNNQNNLKAAGTSFTIMDNGSDQKLVVLVQTAIGCTPYQIQDLADPTGQTLTPTLATNELQAMLAMNVEPRAFLPNIDPMVVNANGLPDVNKLNAYRALVGQSTLTTANDASTKIYCNNMFAIGAPAIAKWLPLLVGVAAPDFGVGISNTLAGVLIGRYAAAVNSPANGGVLNCPALVGQPNPLGNFTIPVAGGALVCPPPFNAVNCALPATSTQTIAQVLRVANMQPDLTGQFTVDVPAGLTINVAGAISPTSPPGTTTAGATTSSSTTAFSPTSFAAGIGVMAGFVLICGVAFYFMVWRKNAAKNVITATNMSMNRF